MPDPKLLQELFDILGGVSKKPKVTPSKPIPSVVKPPAQQSVQSLIGGFKGTAPAPKAAPAPAPTPPPTPTPPPKGPAQPSPVAAAPAAAPSPAPAASKSGSTSPAHPSGFTDPQLQQAWEIITGNKPAGVAPAAAPKPVSKPAPAAAPTPTAGGLPPGWESNVPIAPPSRVNPVLPTPNQFFREEFNIPVYHGTSPKDYLQGGGTRPFTQFNLPKDEVGVHLGTYRAAHDIRGAGYPQKEGGAAEAGFMIYPLRAQIHNPIELPDLGSWTAQKMHAGLRQVAAYQYKGKFTNEEIDAAAKMGIPGIRALLDSKGFDAVKYVNKAEHPGSTSYMIWHPEQLRSPWARFDPFEAQSGNLMASFAGVGAMPLAAAASLFGPDSAKADEARAQGNVQDLIGSFQGEPAANQRSVKDLIGGFGVSRETADDPLQGSGFWHRLLDIPKEAAAVAGEGAQTLREIGERRAAKQGGFKPGASLGARLGELSSAASGMWQTSGIGTIVDAATRALIGRPLAQTETARLKAQIGTPYPGYKFPDQTAAEDAQASDIAEAATAIVPGMGIVPGLRGVYSRMFRGPLTPLQSFSGNIADDLQKLRQMSVGDRAELTEYVKQSPLVQNASGLFTRGKKQAREYLNTVQEVLYNLIEVKDVAKLPPEQQLFVQNIDNLRAVVEAGKHLAPLRLEASKTYEYLRKIKGIPANELIDPAYVHRRAVGHTPAVDPTSVTPNPITGYAGQPRGLPTSTTALQERKYMGAEEAGGGRVVISQDDAGNWHVQKKGQPPAPVKMVDEEHFEYQGKEYTIGQATTREIEAETPTQYHKNALANTVDAVARLRAVARHVIWLDQLKKNPLWQLHATTSGKLAYSKGWQKIKLPTLDSWWAEPRIAEAFNDFYKGGQGGILDSLRKVNQFATASLFWNPTPHVENVLGHWLVGRGWDWIKPQGARSLLFDGGKAIRAVWTQNADYRRLLEMGSGLVLGGVRHAQFYQEVARLAGMQIAREPHQWDLVGRALGVKLSPVEWTRLLYEGSKRTLWYANDVLMMQRVLELERKGMSLREAVREAEKHIPNYRIPTRVMGSRVFSQILQEPSLTVFSRYHYGVFRSYAHMLRDALGPQASAKERMDAMGNLLALGLLTWVVYPALSDALQRITGEPEAKKAVRGPSARISLLGEIYEGKKGWGQALSDSITIAPATGAGVQLARGGRDPFTGQPITEQGSTAEEQIGQATDWALGTMFSPYRTFGGGPSEEEGGRSVGRRVLGQIIGEENTSEAALRGRRIGQKIERRRAQKRRIRPKGPIERLLSTYGGTE